MTLESALDFALALLCAGALAFAVKVLVRARGRRIVRVSGRTVRRPRVWATGVICLAVASLLRLGNVSEILPGAWHLAIQITDLVLSGAFVVLFLVYGVGRARGRTNVSTTRP